VLICNYGNLKKRFENIIFGNYLFNSIYELEQLAQVPQKFKYPLFETFHWYAAKYFYDELHGQYKYILSSLIYLYYRM